MTTRDTTDPELHRSLELLWSGRPRGQRGPRARLTVEGIAQAAVRIADADGLEALSMQRIATELGYSTMSLYNHVPSKDLLLVVAADVGAGAPPVLDDIEDHRQAIRTWVGALWSGFQQRPWMLRVTLDHAHMGPHQLAWLESVLRHLLALGLAGSEASMAALHLTAVVRGTAQISLNMTNSHRTDDGVPRFNTDLAQIVAEFGDPEHYPALTAVHAADHPGPGRPDGDALPFELSFGVDRFLDGLGTWIATNDRRTS